MRLWSRGDMMWTYANLGNINLKKSNSKDKYEKGSISIRGVNMWNNCDKQVRLCSSVSTFLKNV